MKIIELDSSRIKPKLEDIVKGKIVSASVEVIVDISHEALIRRTQMIERAYQVAMIDTDLAELVQEAEDKGYQTPEALQTDYGGGEGHLRMHSRGARGATPEEMNFALILPYSEKSSTKYALLLPIEGCSNPESRIPSEISLLSEVLADLNKKEYSVVGLFHKTNSGNNGRILLKNRDGKEAMVLTVVKDRFLQPVVEYPS